ncbi:MAG: restriction endonuclease [Planctomycetaceae bacterium]|nr:restriction endonuclease [Planctomycetaceae bacterium]
MVVTTSSFSSGAIQAAIEADIRLMDGAEFATRLCAAN